MARPRPRPAAPHPAPPPVGWVKDHVAAYVASNGRDGHLLRGRPTLLITTRGRRTGAPRRTGVTYARTPSAYIVADSNGGASSTPAWSLNLAADRSVQLQVGDLRTEAVARFLEGAEREAMWRLLNELDPLYAHMQLRTSRRFHVIALEPTTEPVT